MTTFRLFLPIASSLIFSSCASVSNFSQRPSPELPPGYEANEMDDLEVKDSLLDLFHSAPLTEIVEQALENNPDLQRSQARLEEVGFDFKQSKASRFPFLTASGSAGRSQSTGESASSLYSAGLDASWEVDAWGRLRSTTSAARSDLSAAQADYNAVRQSLAAQTMQAWFSLIAAEKSLELDERSVESFASTVKLVNRRFELCNSTLAALDLAQTDLQNAKADLELSRDLRDQAARRLHELTGSYPNAELSATVWPQLETTVAPDLPSDLLLKRPDIVAAFNRIQAADARSKIAHRDLFPSIILTGAGGRLSNELSDLSDSAFDSWSALLNLSLPIIDGGQRRAALGSANKRAEQAYFEYQSTVLNALREVENALGSEFYLASEENARLMALKSAQSAYERTQRDYEEGIADILSLLETQRRVFTTEQQTINLRAARLSNRVSLALALGKGA